MEDKTAVGAHIYIEDSPKNIERLRELEQEVIIFSNSTNREVPGLRANTWGEVEEMVLERQDRYLKDK
jgi:5'(3')-deoxyribonucleotidase